MKFLCDICKAKYQIADEKVSGKTVRMKCRRCGHLIEITAAHVDVATDGTGGRGIVDDASVGAIATDSDTFEALPSAPKTSAPVPQIHDELTDEPTAILPPERAPIPAPAPSAPFALTTPRSASSASIRAVSAPRPLGGAPTATSPSAPRPLGLVGRPSSITTPSATAPRAPLTSPSAPRPVGLGSARPLGLPATPRSLTSTSSAALKPVTAPSAPAAAIATKAPEAKPAAPPTVIDHALARSVADEPAPLAHPTTTPTENWYVGVGGVPLGPIRLAVIREKAASGAVTGESLVWREGFDEWLPLRHFPELLEIVEEARAGAAKPAHTLATPSPAMGVTPPPLAVHPAGLSTPVTQAPAAQGPAELAPTRSAPRDPGASSAAPALVSQVPPAPAVATGFSIAPPTPLVAHPTPLGPQPPQVLVTTAPPPAPAPDTSPAAGGAAAVAAVSLAPAAAAPPSHTPVTTAAAASPLHTPVPQPTAPIAVVDAPAPPPAALPAEAPPRRREALHPAAYAFIAMAAAFGGVAAFVLLSRGETPAPVSAPETVATQATAPPYDPAGAAVPPPPVVDTAAPLAATAAPTAATVGGGKPGNGGPVPTADKGQTAAPIDTSGFGTPGGPSGPSANPGGPGEGTSGLPSTLTAGEIQGVVAANQASIRRKCWEPALDAAGPSGKKTAKVTASVTIAPSGNVSSASTSGGGDFPGLASCIAARIKGWKFPVAAGESRTSIPFVFASQ